MHAETANIIEISSFWQHIRHHNLLKCESNGSKNLSIHLIFIPHSRFQYISIQFGSWNFGNSSIAHELRSRVKSPSSEVNKNKEMAGCLKWFSPRPMFALKILYFEIHKFIIPNVQGQIKLRMHRIARNHYRIACLMFYVNG